MQGASGDELAALPIPDHYRAAFVRARGHRACSRASTRPTRTPARASTSARCRRPTLAPDEAYVAVMASSINFNTVWTSIFEPLPTFGFLDRLGKESEWAARHALDYHVVGSDGAGVVLRVGSARAQLEAGRPGHRPLQLRRRPGPDRRTTTRCWPPTSASGASRPTSAAWPTSPS